MALGGYANRVARVDLTSGTVSYEEINEDDVRLYIGARGLGVKFLFDNGPAVDARSPENMLALVNGPLTGTEATMSGRLAFVTKSPLTGTVVDSHMGGWSAARLRWAGFDALLFTGKSAEPVYAYVEDGAVELRPASDIWGHGVHDTVTHYGDRYGSGDLSVMAIGQAGENEVLFASIINEDDRAAGRGGTGAVAGSKNLKAVVVKANNSTMPRAADREKWRPAHERALKTIMDSEVTGPNSGGLSLYGTNVLMNPVNTIGALPYRNAQETTWPEAEKVSGETVRETVMSAEPTCHACPVACKKEVEISSGPYAGLKMESFEYEPAWSLGANCGNSDVAVIAKVIDQCNDYGMDAIEIGNAMSMYMEATEKEYVTGPGLAWGDGAGMVETATAVANRDGIGATLADGTAQAADSFGHPEIAMTVKGQAIPAYDPRGLKGEAIGYATSNRGACHLRGYTPASELLGIPVKTDPLEWKGKGELLKIFQDLHAFSDSLDLCKFSAFAEGAEEYAMQYEAIVGEPLTADDVMLAGERIYNLERHYNNLLGFAGDEDSLPERFLKEPATGGAEGSVVELDEMKAEYYAARGWEDGVAPDAKLKELQIIS
ncbi:MAG: aldehyde ferredoxin oxidoreductase family protein [Dehalococcoidia bacterium]|jgi:aldehyde:ferredoxin oxidoreductase|nr:aldehyde ferredoxin oxidoreductase family protein [Dehalococcoidia bacterium]